MVLGSVSASEAAFDYSKTINNICKEEKNFEAELKLNYNTLIDNFAMAKSLPKVNWTNCMFNFCKNASAKLLNFEDLKELHNNKFYVGWEYNDELSKLLTYFAYFFQSVDFLRKLPDELCVRVLELPGKILNTLCASMDHDGIFYKNLYPLAYGKYNGVFFITRTEGIDKFLCYAIGVFLQQMCFIIEQYGFLAEYYHKNGDASKCKEYLQNAFIIFKQTQSQLAGERNFIDETLAKSKYFEKLQNCLLTLNEKDLSLQQNLEAELRFKLPDNTQQLTTMHIAAFRADFDVINGATEPTHSINDTDAALFTPLHCAVLAGDAVVKHLLTLESIDVNAKSKAGLTALHIATISSSIEVIKTLLKQPAIEVNAKSLDDWTVLHIAVSLQNLEIVTELLKIEALDVNAKMFGGITPLHIAARFDDKNLVQMLLDGNAKVGETTANGLTAQQIAERFECSDALKLLEAATEESSLKTTNLQTAAVLTKDSAEISAKTGMDNATVETTTLETSDTTQTNEEAGSSSIEDLFRAIQKGELDNIKSLVAKGADVEAVCDGEKTVLKLAVLSDKVEVFKYFFEQHTATSISAEELVFKAARFGSLEILKYLLKKHTLNPQIKNKEYKSLFWVAFDSGSIEIVKYLLEDEGVPIPSTAEKCPLRIAIGNNNLGMVKCLLDMGAKILGNTSDIPTLVPISPILVAAENSCFEIFLHLLERGASLGAKYKNKGVLEYAAIGGSSDILKFLVNEKHYKLDITMPDNRLSTFFQAARAGKLKDIKYFIEEHKFDIFAKGPLQGTVLHEAAFNKNIDVIKFFAEVHGLDIKARDTKSFIPLFYAVQVNNLAAVKYFVSDRKLDPHMKDNQSRTTLHIAALNGSFEVFRYLVEEHEANYNFKDNDGLTPFRLTFRSNNAAIFEYLLDRGYKEEIPLNATALHIAAQHGNVEIIKMLIEKKKMNPNVADAAGETALFYAARFDKHAAVIYLKGKGLKTNVKNSKGLCPLDYTSNRCITYCYLK